MSPGVRPGHRGIWALGRSVAILCLLPGLVACGSKSRRGEETLVLERDSAEVRIIEHTAGAWETAPRLRLYEPELRLSPDMGEEYEFGKVTAGFALPGDTLVVADGLNRQLRFFGPDGAYVRSLGRSGGGPGEFGSLRSVAALGPDTILIWDDRNARITLLNARGVTAAEFKVAPGALARGLIILGRLEDGSWVGRTRNLWYMGSGRLNGDVIRDSVGVVRLTPDASSSETWRSMPNYMLDVRPRTLSGLTRRSPFPFAFSPTAHVATGGGRTVTGTSADFEFTVERFGGPAMVVRLDLPPRPVTPAAFDALLRARRRELSGREQPQINREMTALRETSVAENFPAYARILVGRDGSVWVQRYAAPGDGILTWAVFDLDGQLAGRLDVPPTLRLLSAERGRVVAVLRDELDVETVILAAFGPLGR